MQQLISITTDGQGSSVVSARELYAFLEVKQQFADWIKSRIVKYGFREEEDYVEVCKNLESGGFSENVEKPAGEGIARNFHKTMKDNRRGPQATDYALTLDMAKELSMVERNQKGKEARLYFINAEKVARALATQPPPPAEALPSRAEQAMLHLVSQQTQLLSSQQAIISQLRADVDQIQRGRRPGRATPGRISNAPTLPGLGLPDETLRPLVSRAVNDYCGQYGAEQGEVYNYLYKRFFEAYGINAYRLPRAPRETILDGLERHGYLRKLYELVEREFRPGLRS